MRRPGTGNVRFHLGCFSGSHLNVRKGCQEPRLRPAGRPHLVDGQTTNLGGLRGWSRELRNVPGEDFARPESAEAESPGRAGGRRQASVREAASQEGKPPSPQALLDHRPRLRAVAGTRTRGTGRGRGGRRRLEPSQHSPAQAAAAAVGLRSPRPATRRGACRVGGARRPRRQPHAGTRPSQPAGPSGQTEQKRLC